MPATGCFQKGVSTARGGFLGIGGLTACGVVPFLIAFVACAHGVSQPELVATAASSPTVERLVGYWKTDLRLTQLGNGVDRLCLASDGTFRSVFWSEGAVVEDSGTYEVVEHSLRFAGR
jgi:hypothetical protein